MKLILNNEIELEVLSSSEIKELNENAEAKWVLTIEAQGRIEAQQIDKILQDTSLIAVLKDENGEEKDLSSYEVINNIRILYGQSFNENVIRIRMQERG